MDITQLTRIKSEKAFVPAWVGLWSRGLERLGEGQRCVDDAEDVFVTRWRFMVISMIFADVAVGLATAVYYT